MDILEVSHDCVSPLLLSLECPSLAFQSSFNNSSAVKSDQWRRWQESLVLPAAAENVCSSKDEFNQIWGRSFSADANDSLSGNLMSVACLVCQYLQRWLSLVYCWKWFGLTAGEEGMWHQFNSHNTPRMKWDHSASQSNGGSFHQSHRNRLKRDRHCSRKTDLS